MNPSSSLFRLQKIDTDLDLVSNRASQIEHDLNDDHEMQESRARLNEAQVEQQKSQRKLKSIEEEVKALQIKLSLADNALYAGKIKNPKELQDLEHEIASLKKRISAKEDEQLDAMGLLEEADHRAQNCQMAHTQSEAADIERKSALKGELSTLLQNQKRLSLEKGAVLPSLPEDLLATYERLRKQKRGLAVAQVLDGACSGCGVSLRPAEIQMVRSSNEIVYCASCGRILCSFAL